MDIRVCPARPVLGPIGWEYQACSEGGKAMPETDGDESVAGILK